MPWARKLVQIDPPSANPNPATPIERLFAAIADQYTIERELGSGGMATVHLAHDIRHDRKVAIKVLRPELAAAIGADRFVREITTTANLRHPHILPLYDSGTAEGFLYYVMPLVEGESLADRLRRDKQLPLDEALTVAREVADALSYAHRHGVVHRDIKPENILLESGHAVVADFGIATAAGTIDSTRLTETGLSLGTPLYMSPEQAAGEREIDGRSDLYSLACVVYEMLGGQPPFSGPTVESVVHQHIAVEAPAITNIRPAVPAEVAGVLQRALAKNPADRYSPIGEFSAALRSHGHTGTSTSRRTPVSPGVRNVLIGAVGAVVGFVAFDAYLSRGPDAADPASVAVLPFDNFSPDSDDAYFASGMTEEITNQLSRLEDLRVASRTAVTEAIDAGLALSELAAELNVRALLEGSVRKAGDQVRISVQLVDAATRNNLWSNDFDREMSDIFAIQSDVARSIVTALDAELTPGDEELLDSRPTTNTAAYNLYIRALELSGAIPEQNLAAIELLTQAVTLDSSFVQAMASLAWRYTWRARTGDEVVATTDSAFTFARRAISIDSTSASAYYALGTAYALGGRLSEAIPQYNHALRHNPRFNGALSDGSAWLTETGQLAAALDMVSPTIYARPNVPNTRFHIAVPLLLLEDDGRTDAWLRLSMDHDGMGYRRLEVMMALLDAIRGRRDEARDRALAGLERFAGVVEYEALIAHVLLFLDDTESAGPIIERRYDLAPDVVRWFFGLTNRASYAWLLHLRGEPDRAAPLFDQALQLAESRMELGDETVRPRWETAAIHAIRGNPEEALRWLSEAYDAGFRMHRFFRTHPVFASIHDHPEFVALMDRMADAVQEQQRIVAQNGYAFVVDSMIDAAGIRR